MFWEETIEIKRLSIVPRYIDVHVHENPHYPLWRGTFVYGEPKAHERHHMWNLLRRIEPSSKEPWMMIGDFNEIMQQSEPISESNGSERYMSNFQEVFSWCTIVRVVLNICTR